jgi:hypothetical protein
MAIAAEFAVHGTSRVSTRSCLCDCICGQRESNLKVTPRRAPCSRIADGTFAALSMLGLKGSGMTRVEQAGNRGYGPTDKLDMERVLGPAATQQPVRTKTAQFQQPAQHRLPDAVDHYDPAGSASPTSELPNTVRAWLESAPRAIELIETPLPFGTWELVSKTDGQPVGKVERSEILGRSVVYFELYESGYQINIPIAGVGGDRLEGWDRDGAVLSEGTILQTLDAVLGAARLGAPVPAGQVER